MRKKLILAISLVLVLGAAVYGTVAYMTASVTAHNVITAGNVQIELRDQTLGEEGALIDFPVEGGLQVMPGVTADKLVSVENVGNNPCWVRVKLDKTVTLAGEEEPFAVDNEIILNFASLADWDDNWVDGGDGFYYYTKPLLPAGSADGTVTPYLFTEVYFNGELGNEYQGSTVVIKVTAYAVQSENNMADGDVLGVVGWPDA